MLHLVITNQKTTMRWVLLLHCLLASVTHAHSRVSRHLILEDLSMVAIVGDAETTEGPYFEDFSDYVNSSDIVMTGQAGSPGLTEDRMGVVDGVPMEITFQVYDVSNDTVGTEYENVEVYLWHADSLGVYSAVDRLGTGEEMWLRGRQVTDAEGKVTFSTILPGWYTGRAIHYHLRFRFLGQEQFAATTQLYVGDDFLASYASVDPYRTNMQQITPLATDMVYNGVDSTIAEMLTLPMTGSLEEGFTATFMIGLLPSVVSNSGGIGGPLGGPGGPPPDGPPRDSSGSDEELNEVDEETKVAAEMDDSSGNLASRCLGMLPLLSMAMGVVM